MYCAPNWTEVKDCLPDESVMVWFNDSNGCMGRSAIPSYAQTPQNITQSLSCDYNGDGIIGNASLVNTDLQRLEIVKENSTMMFREENSTIIELSVQETPIKTSELFIQKQDNLSAFSFIIVRGLNLSANSTKTVYADRILNGTGICAKDMEIQDITEISPSCKGEDESWMPCQGSRSSYSCEIVQNGSLYKVSGLRHSGIREQGTYCGDGLCNGEETCSSCPADCGACPVPPSQPPSGGGSSGGSGSQEPPKKICMESWSCGNWSACINSSQSRSCSDFNDCGTIKSKPELSRVCASPICAPEERMCSGNTTLKTCSQDGLSWMPQECENGCSAGACGQPSFAENRTAESPQKAQNPGFDISFLFKALWSLFLIVIFII
jgi:hypothetical protein